MTKTKHSLAEKTTTFVENHTFLAGVLAALCLAFAVNFYFAGPGSDGGSGLGGTGRFGGESGLGGTGKAPDPGSPFKLGASDTGEQNHLEDLESVFNSIDDLVMENTNQVAINDAPVLDISILQLTPEPLTEMATINMTTYAKTVSVSSFENPEPIDIREDIESISAETLTSSFEILNSLMLAEAETSLQLVASANLESLADSTAAIDATIRNRISVPVRPERPDRFTIPTRITPVQRVGLPAPPPVRPMRTLSTILNR